MSEWSEYLKEQGYITYEELGNVSKRWVGHKNCPRTTHSFPYPERILDETHVEGDGPVGMCWGCFKAVDPEAMEKIRERGKPVETPGVSCWWVLEMD